MIRRILLLLATLLLGGAVSGTAAQDRVTPEPTKLFGVLQSTVEHAERGHEAGWRVAVISATWDSLEPQAGKWNEAAFKRLIEQAAAFRKLGYRLQLDVGLQYPPAWVFEIPHARYRNQFGAEFTSREPGKKSPNAVFNQAVRDRIATYLEQLFARLGTDWDWVRLGGGFYGEVNYPIHEFEGKRNAYWGFDALAQGQVAGLAQGVKVCPVPGWIPGNPVPATAATEFLEWYLGSLQNYHDWQIQTVRKWFPGEICMLYGSWGIRPGGSEATVAGHLAGKTPAESVGEISMGYDWPRMVGGITDPKVIVYCTWIDAPPEHCDDGGTDPSRWSPVHWLSSLAADHPLRLKVWGENTGRNHVDDMRLTFERVRQFGLMGVMWAFESDLFAEPNPRKFANFADFAENIRNSISPSAAPN